MKLLCVDFSSEDPQVQEAQWSSGVLHICRCVEMTHYPKMVVLFSFCCCIAALLGQLEDKRAAGTEGSKQFFYLTSH